MNINDKDSDLFFIKEILLFLKEELALEKRSVAYECLEKGITFDELRCIENYFFEYIDKSVEQMPTMDDIVKKIRHIVDLENFSESATIDLMMALHCENRIPIMGTILEKNNLI